MTAPAAQSPETADQELRAIILRHAEQQSDLLAKLGNLQGELGTLRADVATMRLELSANTQMTATLRDASTFVRVGTSVLKWLGVIAIAVGSLVAGWKMATGTAEALTITPRP